MLERCIALYRASVVAGFYKFLKRDGAECATMTRLAESRPKEKKVQSQRQIARARFFLFNRADIARRAVYIFCFGDNGLVKLVLQCFSSRVELVFHFCRAGWNMGELTEISIVRGEWGVWWCILLWKKIKIFCTIRNERCVEWCWYNRM